jgi:hypothetical protein
MVFGSDLPQLARECSVLLHPRRLAPHLFAALALGAARAELEAAADVAVSGADGRGGIELSAQASPNAMKSAAPSTGSHVGVLGSSFAGGLAGAS